MFFALWFEQDVPAPLRARIDQHWPPPLAGQTVWGDRFVVVTTVHTTLSGTPEDATMAIVAGPAGAPPVTVLERPSAESRVDAVRALAPADGRPAILSMMDRGGLHLVRLDDGGPRIREVPELRAVEPDPGPSESGHVRYIHGAR